MKKLLLLILPILLCIFSVNLNVKADSDSDGWYIPDLEDYTFFIPEDSEDYLFRRTYYDTGETHEPLYEHPNFGVFQTSYGALNFESVENTLVGVFYYSIPDGVFYGTKFGLTPLIRNLPSYVSYNIFNTTDYIGAIDIHVITYRLDFLGNYSMLLDDYIYDIVYSLVVTYELNINYDSSDFDYILARGYTIHWYDITDKEEYELYTPFEKSHNLLLFQLKKLAGQENGDYDKGYQDGFIAGEKSKLAKNNEYFYNRIAIWIPAVITVVALASIISIFGIKKKE